MENIQKHITFWRSGALRSMKTAELLEEDIGDLRTISTFNIAGRYDSIKLQFHKQCTKQYAREQISRARTLYLWLGKEYRKK